MVRGYAPVPISLSDYRNATALDELIFWGVKKGSGPIPSATQFYSVEDRDMIYANLRKAEHQVEEKMRVRLYPGWVQEYESDEGEEVWFPPVRQNLYSYYRRNPVMLRWKHFIAGGRRAFTIYKKAAAVVWSGVDDAIGTVTVSHGSPTPDRREIRVYYPDAMYDKGPEPSDIRITGGNVVLTFPRQRLVDPELGIRRYTPVAWETDSNFLSVVTVAREYNNPSVNARVRVALTCQDALSCTERFDTACLRPEFRRHSSVSILPATYRNDAWCNRRAFRGVPELAYVHYYSGMWSLPPGFIDAVIRLSHTLYPEAPCPTGHQSFDRFWSRDRSTEGSVTRERINCSWGLMAGAWYAWNFFRTSDFNYSTDGVNVS